MNMRQFLILIVLCLSLLPQSSYAQRLSQQDEAIVSAAENYLQSFTTARAKFQQFNADGGQLQGTFYLWRPGRLRFEYDPPRKDLVVADKLMIHFYDSGTGEVSDAPIGQTLADFILRKTISLRGDDLVVEKVRQTNGLIYITVTQKDDRGMGALSLVFRDAPYELLGWTIVDAQGSVTSVRLRNLDTDIKLPASLFVFKSPQGKLNR
jgi:outer membrane lipoprotein-sorting protein